MNCRFYKSSSYLKPTTSSTRTQLDKTPDSLNIWLDAVRSIDGASFVASIALFQFPP